MAIRGILAYDDQGRLVEVDPNASDPNNPAESDIQPVEFRDIVALSGQFDSVSTADIIDSDDGQIYDVGDDLAIGAAQLSKTAVNPDNNYNHAPITIVADNGDWLIFYRADGTDHTSEDGDVVVARSSDNGQTWSEEIIVGSDADNRATPDTAFKDPDTGNIILIVRQYDFGTSSTTALNKYLSTDNAQSFSGPNDLLSITSSGITFAYGGGIKTTNGLMTLVFADESTNLVEAIFSTDNGQTFGNATTVATGGAGEWLNEPTPIAVTESDILVYGRDADGTNQSHYYVKSTDGGATWNAHQPLNLDTQIGTPPQGRARGNVVTVYLADRDDGIIRQYDVSADWLLDNPKRLEFASYAEVAEITTGGSKSSDYGYPYFDYGGPSPQNNIVAWYEGSSATGADIIVATGAPYQARHGGELLTVMEQTGTGQSVPTATPTQITFDQLNEQSLSGADLSNNQFVAPADGKYEITAKSRYDTYTGGHCLTQISIGGTTVARDDRTATNSNPTMSTSTKQELSAGDTVLVETFHETGSDETLRTGDRQVVLEISKV